MATGSRKKDPNFPMQGKQGGMGGRYGSKSTGLTAKQLKAAGAAKAAKKRTVSISDTRREGNKTLGPGGKPLTGTVKLANGKTAVYKGGRRVQAADARKPASTGRGGSSGGGKTYAPPSDTGLTAAQKATKRRQEQNKGVPDGKVKIGARGNVTRKYNAKTGRWVPVAGTTRTAQTGRTAAGANALAKDKSGPSGGQGTGKNGAPATPTRSPDSHERAMAGRAGSASQRDTRGPNRSNFAVGVDVLAAGAGVVGRGAANLLPGVSAGSRSSKAEARALLAERRRLERERAAIRARRSGN
jgi:hypothetical protein